MSNQKSNSKSERRLAFQGGAQITEHHTKQVDFLMGRERQKDLLSITCALITNQTYFHAANGSAEIPIIVDIAEKILQELESRVK